MLEVVRLLKVLERVRVHKDRIGRRKLDVEFEKDLTEVL